MCLGESLTTGSSISGSTLACYFGLFSQATIADTNDAMMPTTVESSTVKSLRGHVVFHGFCSAPPWHNCDARE
jgi:hypothetical protein